MPIQVLRLDEKTVQEPRALVEKLNRTSADTAEAVRALEDELFHGARRITSQAIGTGATVVWHSLGRVPLGWIVTNRNADARVWQSAAATATQLTLIASAAVTVDLVVF